MQTIGTCFSSLTIKAITLKIQFSFSAAGKETLLTAVRLFLACSAAQPGPGELVIATYNFIMLWAAEINTWDFRVKIY